MSTDSPLQSILGQKESQTFECKRAKKKPSQVLATLCAFANSEGGVFVYGLGDPEKMSGASRLIGLSEAPDHADELIRLLSKNFDSTDVNIDFLHVTVSKTVLTSTPSCTKSWRLSDTDSKSKTDICIGLLTTSFKVCA